MRSQVILLLSLLVCNLSFAVEVGGIKLNESITLHDGSKLVLHGAGIRSKFFFTIYVGALYIKAPKQIEASNIIANPDAKRVLMHFLYKKVDKEKLDKAWLDGFQDNTDETGFKKLKTRLATFSSYFDTMVKGDEVLLDYIPGQGTKVTINNLVKGTIPGVDFHQALLRVWLGDNPADWGLKASMLGQD